MLIWVNVAEGRAGHKRNMSSSTTHTIESVPGWSWRYLDSSETAIAFPIVMVTGGGFDLAQWLEMSGGWLQVDRKGGERNIVALASRSGTLVAIFFCNVDSSRPTMHVPFMRVLEITDILRTIEATFEVAIKIAKERMITEIFLHFELDPDHGTAMRAILEEEGQALGLVSTEAGLLLRLPLKNGGGSASRNRLLEQRDLGGAP
jgi:hypothetical protein